MVREVFVVGMGMGNPDMLSVAACEALHKSELIIGSPRLLEALAEYDARKVSLVMAQEIADELHSAQESLASVVMSGDVGFYSGATGLYEYLDDMEVHVIPGISSLSYLCAKVRVPWQDAYVVSAHGRKCDVAGAIQSHAKTFVLLGGAHAASQVCAELASRGLGDVQVVVGQDLSYPSERILYGTAEELVHASFDGLCVLLAQNSHPLCPEVAAPHLTDAEFVRGKVPMTKEEVRELAICKLHIRPGDVVWDIGAGTGSVSVEAARAAYAGQVFAVEKNDEALGLIKQNRQAFGLPNVHVVAGEAPGALGALPAPNCAFVGGSSGRLEGVLDAVMSANKSARICITAISLETLTQVLSWASSRGLADVDIVQISVAKAHKAGTHHLMKAQNPVYVIVLNETGDSNG